MRGQDRTDGGSTGVAVPWSRAWELAALGPEGFWRNGPGVEGPAAHFRTGAHVGPALARALAVLLSEVDARLGRPDPLHVVDLGAGRGELVEGVVAQVDRDVRRRLVPVAIDVRSRPPGLDPAVRWVEGRVPDDVPDRIEGLLLAHELLDEVPLDVVVLDAEGAVRRVLVDGSGEERVGPSVDDADDLAWLARWWPLREPGDRAEVGRTRDDLWRACVSRLARGTALCVDYGHTRAERDTGRYAGGTLTAYREGRQARAVPDGSVNLTAHVAVDAVAAAVGAQVMSQRDALRGLVLRPALPPSADAERDPAAYADALQAASDMAELLDPSGLGGFAWVRLDR